MIPLLTTLLTRKTDKSSKANEETYTFANGSELILDQDGRAKKYISADPSFVDQECKDFILTERYIEFFDSHPSSPKSKRVPPRWMDRHPELFSPGPERIRIYFDSPHQKAGARALLDGLEGSVHYIEASKQQRMKEEKELADLKRFINEHIVVTVDGQVTSIDIDGEVSCPKCGSTLKDPKGHLELVKKAIEARGRASVEKEGLVHCKDCNELYSFKLAITEVAKLLENVKA